MLKRVMKLSKKLDTQDIDEEGKSDHKEKLQKKKKKQKNKKHINTNNDKNLQSGNIHDLQVIAQTSNLEEVNQKTKQENALAVLKNERMKLKNVILKNQIINPKSSTNEGSKSVNTFDRFKNFKINSGSQSQSSPRSSQVSSNSILALRPIQINEAKLNDTQEENASSISLFAGSLSLSQNSKLELKNFITRQGQSSAGIQRLPHAILSKQSVMSVPLVEYDSLNQKVQRNNSFRSPNEMRMMALGNSSENFSQEGSRKLTDVGNSMNMQHNGSQRLMRSFFNDVVQEEKFEDENTPLLLNRRASRFLLVKDQNEFNKPSKRNKSQEFKDPRESINLIYHDDNVIEADEEENSDSSIENHDLSQNRKLVSKTYSIGYLTKNINKKIYSDDFEKDNDLLKARQDLKFKIASVQNSAILEDSEYSEIDNPYFSDNSSSSALTNKLKKFSKELTRNYDKSDNESSALSFRSSKVGAYMRSNQNQSGLNEPIIEEEEEIEKEGQNLTTLISETIQKRRKASKHIMMSTSNQIQKQQIYI